MIIRVMALLAQVNYAPTISCALRSQVEEPDGLLGTQRAETQKKQIGVKDKHLVPQKSVTLGTSFGIVRWPVVALYYFSGARVLVNKHALNAASTKYCYYSYYAPVFSMLKI